MRMLAVSFLLLATACQTTSPVQVQPSFQTSPALATMHPADIAVLPVEDGTPDHAAERHLGYMRQILELKLPGRCYSPLKGEFVDAALRGATRNPGETILTPSYLKRVAGKATDEAVLAVRVDAWDESRLLVDKYGSFQFQAALVAADGTVLWSGTLTGTAKAGGLDAAPREKDGMARSVAELAIHEMLVHLPQRRP